MTYQPSILSKTAGGTGNAQGGIPFIVKSSTFDLKTTGATTLYTVPTGKTLYITDVLIYATVATTVTVAPQIRIGKSAAYNEWIDTIALPALTDVGYVALAAQGTFHKKFDAADAIAIDVVTGATATTLTAYAVIVGFII